ncbi:hypothetical protein PG988_015031 [Apiospora saccharicola]
MEEDARPPHFEDISRQANRCQMRRGNEQTIRDANVVWGVVYRPRPIIADESSSGVKQAPIRCLRSRCRNYIWTDAGAGAPEESKHGACLAAIYSAKTLQIRTHPPSKEHRISTSVAQEIYWQDPWDVVSGLHYPASLMLYDWTGQRGVDRGSHHSDSNARLVYCGGGVGMQAGWGSPGSCGEIMKANEAKSKLLSPKQVRANAQANRTHSLGKLETKSPGHVRQMFVKRSGGPDIRQAIHGSYVWPGGLKITEEEWGQS